METGNSKSKRTGTREWSDYSLNIQRGCEHGCLYCYARWAAVVRHKRCRADQWALPCIDEKKVDLTHRKEYPGVVMFPTTHDITPANLSQYMCVLRKVLDAGNKVLIVSKPRAECILPICRGFKKHQDNMEFRFTIGSANDKVLKFWEPGAPPFAERLACLQGAFDAGYQTSVSCEPYLDSYPRHVFAACKPYITDSFWIGKLNCFDSRVKLDGASKADIKKYVEPLKRAMSDEFVLAMCELLKGEQLVRWKDSVQKVLDGITGKSGMGK